MSAVRVTFTYEPEEPDPSDRTGVTEPEYERVVDLLMHQMGAEDVTLEKVEL